MVSKGWNAVKPLHTIPNTHLMVTVYFYLFLLCRNRFLRTTHVPFVHMFRRVRCNFLQKHQTWSLSLHFSIISLVRIYRLGNCLFLLLRPIRDDEFIYVYFWKIQQWTHHHFNKTIHRKLLFNWCHFFEFFKFIDQLII